jgi:hypothetical protein
MTVGVVRVAGTSGRREDSGDGSESMVSRGGRVACEQCFLLWQTRSRWHRRDKNNNAVALMWARPRQTTTGLLTETKTLEFGPLALANSQVE